MYASANMLHGCLFLALILSPATIRRIHYHPSKERRIHRRLVEATLKVASCPILTKLGWESSVEPKDASSESATYRTHWRGE